jgi:alkanesulfonate monooxygenase SsuD/methylene tetrahydromethanopterin reductase-like flavin-dependent oxidoreductase (luciferase family)
MHVGTTVIFQGQGEGRNDREVYRNELHLGDLAEPFGFDSLWGVEHHFTDYTMCPDVLQYLTYFAGRTQRIRLGSMVVVLPWHHPMRVAEQVSMLDHMSNGRLILGIGRGVARVEFGGFGVDQNNSRDMFVEFGQMILEGLERGYCEFDGRIIKQERRNIRPAPFKSFRGRSYAAAVSPESMPIMARLGVGLLIIPQKPWDQVEADLQTYNRTYREANHTEPPPPVLAGWIFCDHDADKAREGARKYIGAYYQSILQHYELLDDYLGKLRGYESYKVVGKNNVTPELIDKMTEFFLNLQIWGTPEQCYERILEFRKRTGAEAFTAVFSYGGMPYDLAERNMRMFAREIMPELKKLVPVEQQIIARSAAGAEAAA